MSASWYAENHHQSIMLVSYDNVWLFYVGTALLIVNLYVAKYLILRHVPGTKPAILSFLVVFLPSIGTTWALSPDWKNPSVRPIANVVGTPIAILTIPSISFFIDLSRREAGKLGGWYGRMLLEFVLVPLWF